MAQTPTETPAFFQRMLDISGIQPQGADRLQQQLIKLREELAEAREEILQKNKLLQIQRRTNMALDEQQKTLRNRTQAQEDRIRTLESQNRSRRQEAERQVDSSQLPALLEKLKSSQIDLKSQMSSLQRDLLVQRKNNQDLSSTVNKLNSQIQKLKKELSSIQQKFSSQQTGHSRQLQNLGLQLQEEKKKYKQLQKEVNSLRHENKELAANLKNALSAQKPVAAQTPAKVVQPPSKIVQAKSKQPEPEIKKLEGQLKQLALKLRTQVNQRQKTKRTYEKKMKELTSQVNEEKIQKENIKFKFIQLAGQFQRYKNAEFSVQESEYFPSSINQESRIANKPKDIDAEELDEDPTIKVNHLHKDLVKSLNTHLNTIPTQEKISFLSIVTSWSEEQQQRLETSVNDLNEG